jgi:uncharacterized protein VirK/YbjX
MRVLWALLAARSVDNTADACRLACRAAASPGSMLAWIQELDRLCQSAKVPTIPFELAKKPSQRFFQRSLSQPARIQLLRSHYSQLCRSFGAGRVGELLTGATLTVAAVQGRSGRFYRLTLSRSLQNSREGELNVRLLNEDEICIATMALVVGGLRPGDPVKILIGGLQGNTGPQSKSLTVQTTRDLHGLRPKDLLIHAAYDLKGVFDADAIEGISNLHHVHRRADRPREWSADYDAYWRELGGVPVFGGRFLLPHRRTRRRPDEVAASKLRAWKALYAVIDAIGVAISTLKQGRV